MATKAKPAQQLTIKTDFLQARLFQDWKEFERRGRADVAQTIPNNNRASFRAEFQKLEKAGCHADVLFPCLYIFLNSRGPHSFSRGQELKFPWREDWEQVSDGLDRVQEKMNKFAKESGIATLMVGERDLDLDAFSRFKVLHKDLLGTMDQYIGELENLCRTLPRKDIIRQYGQAVIWTYVSVATTLSFSQTSLSTQSLLQCFYKSQPPRGAITDNWARDIKRFQNDYPDFYKNAQSFLLEKHHSAVKLPPPNWKRFLTHGNL
jgi:hypothetical protein